MPAAPSEPEKYTIDEMMDRLKESPSEIPGDGELVTRSDGSQAIRVRKRKRRSTQPHKEQSERTRRARIIQVSAALILVFLAALTVGGAVIYSNSKPFREGVIRMIGQSSGATADLKTFRMNPKTANAGNLALDWPVGNVLENLNVRGINAEVFPISFLGNSLSGEEITVAEANLSLRLPTPGEATRAIARSEGEPPIRFNRYRTPLLNVSLNSGDTPILRLYKSEATLSSRTVGGQPQMRLYRGELAIPGWPKYRMDRALIEFHGPETDIISMRVLHDTDDRGSLSLSGTISPYQPDQASNLTVTLDAFQISGIVGPAMGNIISGRIDSVSAAKSNFLSFSPAANPAAKLDLAFVVNPTSGIQLQGFPFLFSLSQLLDGNDWFETPIFDSDAKGVIHRENGSIEFRDLDLESKGLLAIRGNLKAAPNQALAGNLRVGLPEAMIPKSSRLKSMFGPPEEGFRWISLKIGGSPAAPTDNFKELYNESTRIKEQAPAPAGTGESTFEELTRPR